MTADAAHGVVMALLTCLADPALPEASQALAYTIFECARRCFGQCIGAAECCIECRDRCVATDLPPHVARGASKAPSVEVCIGLLLGALALLYVAGPPLLRRVRARKLALE